MMENLKKVSRAQWCIFALFIGFAFLMQNCSEDDALIYEENQTETELNAKPESNKVDVCRYNERKGTYSVVSVIAKRVQPDDVVLDADGDGYFKENLCDVVGLGIDCDDNNAAINSGALEICGDGIDNDCDGVIDDGCTTFVPDDNFEAYLEANDMGNGNANDDYVLTANINTVTYLEVAEEGIYDLTGIGGFAALENLHCWNNNLSILNLSQNTALITLSCSNNVLTSIDVSNSANLDYMDCNSNLLQTLDLSANTALTYLACTGNQLTALDMSANTALLDLQCNLNSLTSLNISGCPLEYLYSSDNQLSSLDVSSHTALIGLYCGNNNFSSFNISNNTALQEFDCYGNDLLTSLDVSANINLTRLYCYSNPSLTCIKVNADQLATPPANWWKDWDTVYALDCPS